MFDACKLPLQFMQCGFAALSHWHWFEPFQFGSQVHCVRCIERCSESAEAMCCTTQFRLIALLEARRQAAEQFGIIV